MSEHKSSWKIPVLVALIAAGSSLGAAYIGIIPNLSSSSTNSNDTEELLRLTREHTKFKVQYENGVELIQSLTSINEQNAEQLELASYRLSLAIERAVYECNLANTYLREKSELRSELSAIQRRASSGGTALEGRVIVENTGAAIPPEYFGQKSCDFSYVESAVQGGND